MNTKARRQLAHARAETLRQRKQKENNFRVVLRMSARLGVEEATVKRLEAILASIRATVEGGGIFTTADFDALVQGAQP